MWRPIPLFFLIYLGICSFNNSNLFAYFMLSKEPYTYMERENNSCGNIYVNSTLIANSTIEPWTIILLVLASRCRIFISLTHCKYMYGKYHEIVVFLKYHEKLYFLKYFYTGLSVQQQSVWYDYKLSIFPLIAVIGFGDNVTKLFEISGITTYPFPLHRPGNFGLKLSKL